MAGDMFLKFEGIDGESTDAKHEKWIAIESFTHNVTQPVSAASGTGGRTGGKADFGDFIFTKTIDSATPELYLHCANGKHIPKVDIDFCLATEDKHVYMTYTLEDVIVSSVTPAGSNSDADGAKPAEQVSIAYGQIEWEYTPIDDSGNPGAAIKKGWDLEKNEQK